MANRCYKLALVFVFINTSLLRSEDWTTTNGTTYKDVTIVHVDLTAVTINDADGTAVISLSKLPQEIQQKLGSMPVVATASSAIPVSGQLFVVTKGGQNIKLGGVHVRIYLLEDIAGIIKRRQEAATPIIAKLRIVLKDLSDQWLKVSKLETADGGKQQWYADEDMEQKLNAKMAEVRKRCDELSNGEYFLADLPPSVSDVLTDADGKFTATVSSTGSYAVTASAIRDVGEYNENYHWIFKISVADKSGKSLLLTNENMIYHNSPDSLVNEQQ
jgi:hypothetical protein